MSPPLSPLRCLIRHLIGALCWSLLYPYVFFACTFVRKHATMRHCPRVSGVHFQPAFFEGHGEIAGIQPRTSPPKCVTKALLVTLTTTGLLIYSPGTRKWTRRKSKGLKCRPAPPDWRIENTIWKLDRKFLIKDFRKRKWKISRPKIKADLFGNEIHWILEMI